MHSAMKRNEKIQHELTEISLEIAGIDPVNVFTVPEGYFENFAEECAALVQVSPSIDQYSIPQQVPSGYFDHLATEILAKIKSEDAEMPSFGKLKHPFTVPENYFKNVSSEILQKIRPAKVIKMQTHFFRYAAAAVITGILGLSLFNLSDKKDSVEPNIVAYAQNGSIKEDAIDKALESVKDEEIVSYLSATGQDVNAALVASVIDENNLPSSEDYLLDENTLKEFLNENNIRRYN